jgi:hypothetical protein
MNAAERFSIGLFALRFVTDGVAAWLMTGKKGVSEATALGLIGALPTVAKGITIVAVVYLLWVYPWTFGLQAGLASVLGSYAGIWLAASANRSRDVSAGR